IERNSVLLFMIPADTHRTITEEYEILSNELKSFNPELMDKPRILAITKSDMLDAELENEMKTQIPQGMPYIFISSVSGYNLMPLKDLIWKEINTLPASPQAELPSE